MFFRRTSPGTKVLDGLKQTSDAMKEMEKHAENQELMRELCAFEAFVHCTAHRLVTQFPDEFKPHG